MRFILSVRLYFLLAKYQHKQIPSKVVRFERKYCELAVCRFSLKFDLKALNLLFAGLVSKQESQMEAQTG